jgi:hypothetical protein
VACSALWHEGISCEEFQRQKRLADGFDDAALKQWLRDNHGRIHKTSKGGCDHAMLKSDCNSVWCAACKFYFCWFCLERIAEAGASSEQRHAHFTHPGRCYGKCWAVPRWGDDNDDADDGDEIEEEEEEGEEEDGDDDDYEEEEEEDEDVEG